MKHPDAGTWSNHVRGLLGPQDAADMNEHLQGCARCERQVRSLEVLRRVAATDRRIAPPSFALSSVKRLHRLHELTRSAKTPRLRLCLGFDSFHEPSFAGARSADAGGRHLVYESDQLTLDLALRQGKEPATLEIRGQVLDADARPLARVPAFLAERGRITSYALSGGFGEFRLVGTTAGTANLGLVTAGERLIDLALPGLSERDAALHAH